MIRSPIILTAGHVDHGKCVSPETLIPLSDGRILTAEQLYNLYANEGGAKNVEDGSIVEIRKGPMVFTFDGKKILKKSVTHLWKLKAPENMVRIKLSSGDAITTTAEHPFFVLTPDMEIIGKKAEHISNDDFILVPRKLDFDYEFAKMKDEIIKKLEILGNFVVSPNDVACSKLFEMLSSQNLQELRRNGLFSTDPYSSLNEKRFRARDFIRLCRYFGFPLNDIYNMIESVKSTSEKWRAGHTSSWMKIPQTEIEFEKMGYVLGCLAGDGYIMEGKLFKNEVSVQTAYSDAVSTAFGLKTRVMPSRTCDVVLTNGGKTFERFLLDIIDFPKKNKSALVKVPDIVRKHQAVLKSFVDGWFDTDGTVSILNNSVEITSKSEKMVKEVGTLLLALGIHSSIYEKRGYFNLRIANDPYLGLFLSNFSPKFQAKKKRLIDAVEKGSTSRIFDLTPITGLFLQSKNIMVSNNKLPYFSKYTKCKRLSRNFLKKLVNFLPANELREKLEFVVNSEVSYVKVASKEIVRNENEFVYDFTVPDTHNFVAERLIVHNTTLLDKIRGTTVAKGEAGQITQDVGASYIPVETIKEICGPLLEKFKIQIVIPGLLMVDTPGHAAFITLRKRGGSVADLAILVVDINQGFQEQTDESLAILKEYKTPFVVAATKIDNIQGWFSQSSSFLDNLTKQQDYIKDELDRKIYSLVSRLAEKGIESERFDRITDFKKQVAIVPCSALTGEGVSELLLMLTGLSQQFLKDKLSLSDVARGSVLEIKEVRGLGMTIDVILYDGVIHKGDNLIIGGKEPVVTKVKALLTPRELHELRVEKQFETVDQVEAAAGIKISAPNLENVISGSPIVATGSEEYIQKYVDEVQKEVEEVEFTKDIDGVAVEADSLGSVEAMIKLLTEEGIPIRHTDVGQITREDIVAAEGAHDELRRVILAFNVKVSDEIKSIAKDLGVTVFENNVIYRLIEDYKQWCSQKKERELQEKLESVNRPAELLFLKDTTFRSSNPAVFGVEVVRGVLKAGMMLRRGERIIGRVKQVEREGKTIDEAKRGDRVAISMEDVTIGRHVFEGDKLFSALSENDFKILREVYDKLTDSEKELLNELT